MDVTGTQQIAWVANYVDQTGVRRLKTFTTRKEADGWLAVTRHEVRQGTHTPASTSITVTEAAERWIAHCEAEGLERGQSSSAASICAYTSRPTSDASCWRP